MSEPPCQCHLEALRQRQGISQAELARRAGVSRQLVNMVEHGRMVPSVLTAIALADALGCPVTDLFSKPHTQAPLEVTLCPSFPSQEGPVRLALVRNRWIALPVAGSEASGFGEADGQLISRHGNTGSVTPLQTEAQLRQNILVTGCDPALGILRDLWKTNRTDGRIRWQNLSSTAALNALASGQAHIAGVHFPDETTEHNALEALKMDIAVIRFARWEQGWMLRRGNPMGFRSVEDLTSSHIRFLNRATGSGSRLLIDGLLKKAGVNPAQIPLYTTVAASHFDCAEAIREGRADVAIGLKAVAESCGLDFLPVQEVAFDLIIPKQTLDLGPVAKLLDFLQNRDFRRQLDGLPGYATRETGKQIS